MPIVREISEHDLLTWELQLAREGTLPPEVQLRLLEHIAERPMRAVLPSEQVKHERAAG